MGSIKLIFLNATGAPGLSSEAAKQMRSHITKTNFAKRRQRLRQNAETEAAETHVNTLTANEEISLSKRRNLVTEVDTLATLSFATQSSDQYGYVSRLWSHVFLDGREYPTTPEEAAWISLLVSEPALVESSMAVGARHWFPEQTSQQLAEVHSSRAVNMVLQRIKSGSAHADAVIGAVFTMGFGERLMHNNVAWRIHIDGATQLIRERRSRGFHYLPPWINNLLVLDIVNNVLGFPRFYHDKVAEQARAFCYHPLSDIKIISERMMQLLKSIEPCHNPEMYQSSITENLRCSQRELLCQIQALRAEDDPFVKATMRSFELILHLFYKCPSKIDLTPIAGELKDALCRLQLRPCSYMDLTSCQLMIGAIASEKGSKTRAWFVATLKRATLSLQLRGWNEPLEVVKKGFLFRSCFMPSFEYLWEEIGL